MNILLHVCCAPCAIFPMQVLKEKGHKIAGLFYNPNIHPTCEYLKRRSEVERYANDTGVDVIHSDYDIENYFHTVYNEGLNDRCPVCWRLRLEKTAETARDNGFEAFTTTLLGSPYQDQEAIKSICESIAKNIGLKFYYEDFRIGFKKAHELARSKGMYCQNYCGCVFSEKERLEKKKCSTRAH